MATISMDERSTDGRDGGSWNICLYQLGSTPHFTSSILDSISTSPPPVRGGVRGVFIIETIGALEIREIDLVSQADLRFSSIVGVEM